MDKKEYKAHSIHTRDSGYYYESLIVNRTTSDIMVIDHNNSKVTVPPTDGEKNSTVEIIVRNANGSRREYDKKNQNYRDLPLNAAIIKIPEWVVDSSPVPVPELDVIITNPDMGHNFRHPNSGSESQKEIVEAVQGLVSNKDGVFIHFVINDPKGRMDHIFGALNPNSLFKIDVLNENLGAEEATLTMVAGSNSKTHIQEILDIEKLFEEGSMYIENKSISLSLGLTSTDAISSATTKLRSNDREVYAKVSKMLESERKEMKDEIKNLNDTHKQEIDDLIDKHKSEKIKHKEVVSNLEEKITALNEWKTVFEAREEVSKMDQDVRAYEAKRYEAEERYKKAKLATTSEATKLYHTVFKIAGGVVVGVVVPWIIGKMKEE